MKKLSFCFLLIVVLVNLVNHAKAQTGICQEHLRIMPNQEFYIPYVQCNPLEFEQLPLGSTFFGPVCNANGISLDNPYGFFFWTDNQAINMQITHNFGNPFSAQIFIYGPIDDCIDSNNYFRNSCTYQRQLDIPRSNNTEYVSINVGQPGLYIIVIDGTNNAYGDCKIEMIELDNNPGALDKTLSSSVSSGSTGSINVTLTASFSRDSVFTPHPKLTQMFNDCTFICDNCTGQPGVGCNPFDPISIIDVRHPPSWVVAYSSSLDSEEFYVNITECYESGELCVTYQYDNCVDSICIFLEVAFDTLYKCPNETVVYKGETFSDPGDYVVQEGFLFNNVSIINYPGGNRIEEIVELCAGSEYQAPDGQIYTEDAEIVKVINTNNPCPDTMVTLIRFINPEIILSKSGDFSCTSESVILLASVQNIMIPDSIISYWIDPDLMQIDAAPNEPIEVFKPGIYTYYLTIFKGDLICEFSEEIEVHFIHDPDNIDTNNWIQLDNLICEGNIATFHYAGPAQMTQVVMNGQTINIQGNYWTSPPLTENTCFEVLFVSQNGLCNISENICVQVSPHVNQDLGELHFCSGDSILIAGNYYNQGGNYEVELSDSDSCDTTVFFSLVEIAPDTTYLFDTICNGNAYSIHGYVYHEPGTYLILLANQFGCDSLLILNLEVQLSETISSTFYLCPADLYFIRDQEVSSLPWTFTFDSTDISGCIMSVVEQYEMEEVENFVPEIIKPCPGESEGSIRLSGSGSMDNYTFSWNPIVSESNIADNLTHGMYELTITDDNGCSQSFSWNLAENQIQDIDIQIKHESCPGSADGSLELLGDEIAYTYLDGILFDQTQFSGLSPGQHHLEITDLAGCIITRMISIDPGIDIQVEIPDTIYISRAELGSQKEIPVLWSDENQIQEIKWTSAQVLDCADCKYPSIWVDEQDELLLQVKSISGCVRNFKSILFPELKENNFLPAAFSPNGDGINDTWNIYGLQKFSSIHIRIYNRWGVRIADRTISDSSTPLWDGTTKNEMCPPGPYIYQIEWLDQEGRKGKFFGAVELMR